MSFAGQNRVYVEEVANGLRAAGVSVFYDEFEKASLWGKNLVDHLADIYQNRSRYVVMFISEFYADARTDIAGAFPGFSNTAAAGGHAIIDWTALTNGSHTIGWLITDDCARADGVGSRFFNVTTGTALRTAESASAVAEPPRLFASSRVSETESAYPITVARGYGELPEIVDPDADGLRTVEMKQGERIEIRVPRGFESAYQLGPSGQHRPRPVGSTWDADSRTFYWQPAPGFLGRFRLVFSNGSERISVRVLITP